MDASKLRQKSFSELNTLVMELLREQFNLRMAKGSQQLAKPSEMKRVRHMIARVKTVMAEQEKGMQDE